MKKGKMKLLGVYINNIYHVFFYNVPENVKPNFSMYRLVLES